MHPSSFVAIIAASAAIAASPSPGPSDSCPSPHGVYRRAGWLASGLGWLPSWCSFGSSPAPAPPPKVVQPNPPYRPAAPRPKCPDWNIRGLGGPVDVGNGQCCLPGKTRDALKCCRRGWVDKLDSSELGCTSSMWQTPQTYWNFQECNTGAENLSVCKENRIILLKGLPRKYKSQSHKASEPPRQRKKPALPPKVPKPALPPRVLKPAVRVIQSTVNRPQEFGRN
ncbi:hypothetical protein PoMZ_09017 [Pyricularia oryzae]|uniref:Uncharacterized protein n=1 Tax=Pyricularia oryzae TaxID=318829 RepID=A0A4P7MST7_PYROR|nr:hypothetical protein PoMZ_09017 [Pyricularia oryzae]